MSLTSLVLDAHRSDQSGYLSIPIEQINKSGHPRNLGPKKNKPYFFIPADSPGKSIRHCRIYRGGFLDYTIDGTQFFETLEDWAKSFGPTITEDMIMFGFDTPYEMYKFINISAKFGHINEFDKLEIKMKNMGLGINNIAIVHDNKVFMASELK
jgi:hypothetical protein